MLSRQRWWMVVLGAAALVSVGCRTSGGIGRGVERSEVHFAPVVVRGDPELEKLNDEELFAQGTAAYGAGDYLQSARYFDRIIDFHRASPHRRVALYQSGLSHQRLNQWEEAGVRFSELADAQRGTGDALDAVFRLAETHYHVERFTEAAELLGIVASREDLPLGKRLEAKVQQGVCIMETGDLTAAEKLLRAVVHTWQDLEDPREVDDYIPSQAQFFVGEIYRLHYEAVRLDVSKGVDALAQELEYKAQLLLSAQGNYLRAIRMGNGYWATAAGAQVGGLYENLYEHMISTQAPGELDAEQAELYRQELRKKIRVLLSKAISIYERTLEAAERIGAANGFVERSRQSLQKMKDLLLADVRTDDLDVVETSAESPPPPSSGDAASIDDDPKS